MAQDDPNNPNPGISSGTTGSVGSGGTSTGAGYSSGGTGTGMSSGGGMTTGSGGTGTDLGAGSSGFGVSSGNDLGGSTSGFGSGGSSAGTGDETCAHCGQSLNKSGGIEGLLSNLRSQLGNVDVDEYLNTARDYLKGSSDKVTTYTKENPAKVAAGVAALALGAGLIYAAVNRDKTDTSNATTDTINNNPGDRSGGTYNRTGDPDRGGMPGDRSGGGMDRSGGAGNRGGTPTV